MKRRMRLLAIILRNSRVLLWLPPVIAYVFIPFVTISKFRSHGIADAARCFIYLIQVLFPLCGLLLPMGYLHVWVEGDGCEALRSCSSHHKSCFGELLLLYALFTLMLVPVFVFSVILFDVSWFEFVRTVLQTGIILNVLYFMIMLSRNVTIGCIPVIAYIFFCFYISGSAEFASFSIIAPVIPAEQFNWNIMLVVFPISVFFLISGYLLDRFGKKYS